MRIVPFSGTGFDDTALIKISQVYPNLIHLNVSNNGGLTDHSITKIAKKCDKLQFLDIGFSGNITSKSFCEIARMQWVKNIKELVVSESVTVRFAESHFAEIEIMGRVTSLWRNGFRCLKGINIVATITG